MKNMDIREYAKKKGVKLWEIASALHINDGNFSRKLRQELSNEIKQQIFQIIDQISDSNR